MAKIISIHSFRGGTGKSNTSANVAALLAKDGRKVGVVDTDLQSPGIHVIFGVDQDTIGRCLNDYLYGECAIGEAAHEVTPDKTAAGKVWLVPASIKPHDIARIQHEGYDVARLNTGFKELIDTLGLDALILDTHPGLGEETLLSIAMSNSLAVIMRPDQQDYEGTQVTMTVSRKLSVPRIVIVVNKVPDIFNLDEVKARVEKAYDCEVAAVIPHSPELMNLSSGGIFAVQNPDHPVTALFEQVSSSLMSTPQ
jgi:MinD-like ATPase involved in chromosome partitioning or flagellar assembly